jgi:predicted KAP-like P-loop ATPase
VSNYFNDSPIEKAEDDRYGVAPFAEALANSILGIKNPIGTTIALYGEWGSGKSSAVNLIRSALEKQNDPDLVITDFEGWWFRGEEALALAFLQNLSAVLNDGVGDRAKELMSELAERILQGAPIIGQIIGAATANPVAAAAVSGASQILGGLFGKDKTLEKYFAELSRLLAEQSGRFLVVIDDIDRLSPEEAIAVFRLIKSVGRLPNVMYLLVFDRELAEKAVKQRYPSEGPHFLEKIIQAGFNLPPPLQTDVNDAVLAEIGQICGSPPDEPRLELMNVFYDVVVPYITRPRDVVRFRNAISVTWPAIGTEVNMSDFIALETLRIFEPALFKAIRQRKAELCSVQQSGETSQSEAQRVAPLRSAGNKTRNRKARRGKAIPENAPNGIRVGFSGHVGFATACVC